MERGGKSFTKMNVAFQKMNLADEHNKIAFEVHRVFPGGAK